MSGGKKRFSIFESFKQTLIDKLLAASEKSRDETGNVDSAKLRDAQLAILKGADTQTAGLEDTFSTLKINSAALQKFANAGPRRLKALLVSQKPVAFDRLADLASRFGPLPPGYGYRYLAPPTSVVPEAEANRANNVVRLPLSCNLILDGHFEMSGDEIPDRSLGDWLLDKPADYSRLWSLRVFSLFGFLRRSEVPQGPGGPGHAVPPTTLQIVPPSDPKVVERMKEFRELSVAQYDNEAVEKESEARSFVFDKRSVFAELTQIGPHAPLALGTLFADPDMGVRVSAATYLLPAIPDRASPVLQQAADAWPAVDDDRDERAAFHARQALWMYDDGFLRF